MSSRIAQQRGATGVSAGNAESRRRLLMMLDEFPALGRLDFFESALAFMAGYGIRAYLIAQSLNQISKAYGENNSILDNCHVRIAFASNDERTAKRISDSLGTATELRNQRNYAGHRLAPWLSHMMVSRQETARPLLTPGEVMQLPPEDELVLVSGAPPIRAKKIRYYQDRNFRGRVLPPPVLAEGAYADRPAPRPDDWSALPVPAAAMTGKAALVSSGGSEGGLRREPALPEHEEIVPPRQPDDRALLEDDFAEAMPAEQRAARRQQQLQNVTRVAAMDRDDDLLPQL
jgi:type IV secretion system protein VirD4